MVMITVVHLSAVLCTEQHSKCLTHTNNQKMKQCKLQGINHSNNRYFRHNAFFPLQNYLNASLYICPHLYSLTSLQNACLLLLP